MWKIVVCRGALLCAFGRHPGSEFHGPALARHERRACPGVVLTLHQQVPNENRQFARDRDGGDVVAAPCTDALVKGAQRTGRTDGLPGGLDQQEARVRTPALGDTAMAGGSVSRLEDAGIETDIGHQGVW